MCDYGKRSKHFKDIKNLLRITDKYLLFVVVGNTTRFKNFRVKNNLASGFFLLLSCHYENKKSNLFHKITN